MVCKPSRFACRCLGRLRKHAAGCQVERHNDHYGLFVPAPSSSQSFVVEHHSLQLLVANRHSQTFGQPHERYFEHAGSSLIIR